MKRTLIAVASLLPAPALAQPAPYPASGDMPSSLDPGATGTQGPRPAPAPAPAPAPQPNVIVVGPDGAITTPTAEPAESGYYVSGDPGPPGYGEPVEVHSGALPELHVVRSGDTLWDLSFYYFNNPWEWPKVWSYNPQITNPHWIYPGDLVRLLPRGLFASATGDGDTGSGSGSDLDVDTAIRPNDRNLPAPAKRREVGLKQTAFVEKADLDKSIQIVGSVDEKRLLGDGDSVYLSYPAGKPPKVGQRYSIYTPGTQAKQGQKVFGSYVKLLGTVEVVSVKQDKRARGVIVNANQEIERGAKVGPLLKTFKNVPPVSPKVDAQAPIVGLLTRDELIGDGEVVFVGLGKRSGVEVGNRMYVVRRGDAYPGRMSTQAGEDDRAFPARALGEVVIVEVGKDVSVGLVTLAVQEMSVGDLVMMQKSR